MNNNNYEIYAIKYAEVARKAHANFIDGDPHETADMPLNYYVWAILGRGRTVVVDTGFSPAMGKKRGRTTTKPVENGLRAVGIEAQDVRDVVITHMHYDHCGNDDLFAGARYHLQDLEMEYATGRCMCHREINRAFEADDVARMVHRVYDGRVQFHSGADEIAPGISVHHLGGHTMGLQCVRVETGRGAVVLASDASHFYAHMEQNRAFPILYNLGDLLEGYRTLRKLASSDKHVIPGHDPLVIARYPAANAATEGWVARVDAEPRS